MTLFHPVERGRIQSPDGTEHDPSAIWDLHVMVSEPEDLIYLRLSDAHAEDDLAVLYTGAIEAGSAIGLTMTAPIAAGHYQSGPWQPLEEGHFRFGLTADALRLSSAHVTDRKGLMTVLGRLVLDHLKQLSPASMLGLDPTGRILAFVPSRVRSATPQRTIDATQPPGATQSVGQGINLRPLNAALQGLKNQAAGATQPAAPTPRAIPVRKPPAPNTPPSAPKAPRTRKASAPLATPFTPGRPFKSTLKNWF